MPVVFNGSIIYENVLTIDVYDRALRYGDGVFETLIYKKNIIKYFDLHMQRLQTGMQNLGICFEEKQLNAQIQSGIELLQLSPEITYRIRLRVWRKGTGLYLPQSFSYHYLIEADPIHTPVPIGKTLQKVGISEMRLCYTPLSACKTLNALPYIWASSEAYARQWNDALLLDAFGNVSELTSSNLFFWNGQSLLTPSLQAGCISGVARKVLLDKAKVLKIPCEESVFPISEIQPYMGCFSVNVAGYYIVERMDDKFFDVRMTNEFIKTYLKDVWD